MTRKAYDIQKNVQVAILPGINGLRITQGANPSKNGTTVPATSSIYWTHNGYHATDHAYKDEENLYAPFDMECVKIDDFGGGAYFSFFRSLKKVLCADNDVCEVSFLCVHGGKDIDIEGEDASGNPISKLKVGAIIRQGKKFYQMGTEGLGSGAHVHIDIMKGRFADNFSYSTYMKNFPQKNHNGIVMIEAGGLVNGEFIEDIFYKLPTDEILFDSNGENWRNLINFKTYTPEPFSPVGKEDGWHEYNGSWYYVINEQKAEGWQQIDGCWYYLDPKNDCIMKTGWLCTKDKETNKEEWYYFGPSGVMQGDCWVDNDNFYVGSDGKMLTSGWTKINGYFYYFKDKNRDTTDRFAAFAHGQKVTNTWIPGESWYYVKSDGKMAANETVNINGTDYHFDQSGACLNP